MDLKQFVEDVRLSADMRSTADAEKLVQTVFYLLSARLTATEGKQLMSQMPKDVRALWESVSEKQNLKFKKKDFIERVKTIDRLRDEKEAEKAVKAVFSALKKRASKGESDDVAAQLPPGLKNMWEGA